MQQFKKQILKCFFFQFRLASILLFLQTKTNALHSLVYVVMEDAETLKDLTLVTARRDIKLFPVLSQDAKVRVFQVQLIQFRFINRIYLNTM